MTPSLRFARPSLTVSSLALLLMAALIGVAAGGGTPVLAQQPEPAASELDRKRQAALQTRLQQLREQGDRRASRRLLRRLNRAPSSPTATTAGGTNDQTFPSEYRVYTSQATIRPNDNPTPSLNLNLVGLPTYAGDVNGDGADDYLYADLSARDETTPDPGDSEAKTALFYGGNRSIDTPDQFL